MKKILSILFLAIFLGGLAFAADYNLRQITPAIQQALDGRRERYGLLEQLKDQGKIGEGRDGLVVNLTGDPEADAVADRENHDRNVIYNAIVEQNNLPETEIHTVMRVFAETQRSKAKHRQMIQMDTGQWVPKK